MEEDEEAFVEIEDEKYDPLNMHVQPQPQEEISISTRFAYSLLHYFSNPWALLFLLFFLYKLLSWIKATLLAPLMDRYYEWQENRAAEQEAARYKKNPDEYRSRLEEMERARNRMQEIYDQKAEDWASRQKELEEKKRQQDIEDWENHQQGQGYKNRAHTGEDREREALVSQARVKNKKGFRPESNPLMGLGGGGYRPQRRGFSGGGGG